MSNTPKGWAIEAADRAARGVVDPDPWAEIARLRTLIESKGFCADCGLRLDQAHCAPARNHVWFDKDAEAIDGRGWTVDDGGAVGVRYRTEAEANKAAAWWNRA